MNDNTENKSDSTKIPRAQVLPIRRHRLFWLLPLAAALLCGLLIYQFLAQRGLQIQVELQQGHGIKPGDALRYRGIIVGRVSHVLLAPNQQHIQIGIRLNPQSSSLAKAGSRFWIVRPQLELTGITGLDTLLGAKYMAVSPGSGPRRLRFVGLAESPLIENIENGGLELVLQSPRKGSLKPGLPILYRGIPVGTVLSIALARDASAVEARVYIAADFLPLIQQQTRFWRSGGMQLQGGLTGFSFRLDSMQSWLSGGISLATPSATGSQVHNGHRFTLFEDPEEEWLQWQPSLALNGIHLKNGKALPHPYRAIVRWKQQSWWLREQDSERQAWLIAVPGGWLGPLEMFQAPTKADPGTAFLEVAGRTPNLDNLLQDLGSGIGLLQDPHKLPTQPPIAWRKPTSPEDCLIVGDPRTTPQLIAAARFELDDQAGWIIDPALPFGKDWLGASAVAVSDGHLIGILLSGPEGNRIAPLVQIPRAESSL